MSLSISQNDWSLHRRGPKDQARHQEKVREAIKNRLGDIISNEAIITSQGDKIVKVPIKTLDEYHFRYDPGQRGGVGGGPGGTKPGDVIAREPGEGEGDGQLAGQEPGIDYYDAEFTIDELAAMVFKDLDLPNLKDRGQQLIPARKLSFTDVRQKGILPNLDKKRSVLQAIKRHAMAGGTAPRQESDEEASGEPAAPPKKFRLKNDDLRFRTYDETVEPQHNAVVIAMRDVSGSMGDFEKYITRAFYFWMVRFLRTNYRNVEIVFITHHTEAKEVSEDDFFNLGESGGTRVSSAYTLCRNIMHERYPADRWNIYPFHFSDGDNWGDDDNEECKKLIEEIIRFSNIFGYGEIREAPYRANYESGLWRAFKTITAPEFISLQITAKDEVYAALKKFFFAGDLPQRSAS